MPIILWLLTGPELEKAGEVPTLVSDFKRHPRTQRISQIFVAVAKYLITQLKEEKKKNLVGSQFQRVQSMAG